ncbi:MAG: hypothetical protein ACK5S3_15730 [Pirellulaceae bacterium]
MSLWFITKQTPVKVTLAEITASSGCDCRLLSDNQPLRIASAPCDPHRCGWVCSTTAPQPR